MTASSPAVVEPAQAFARNPSVPSLEVEDTVPARADGVEVLTVVELTLADLDELGDAVRRTGAGSGLARPTT